MMLIDIVAIVMAVFQIILGWFMFRVSLRGEGENLVKMVIGGTIVGALMVITASVLLYYAM